MALITMHVTQVTSHFRSWVESLLSIHYSPRNEQLKVLFDTKKVQKMGRVALTEPLLRNAGLKEGDEVDIYFDASTKRIILERVQQDIPMRATSSTSRSKNPRGRA
jgi:bifunctional DNA-binding transcriptional regulator/antitoxin component of YhaV-PrlF toxin-antitoxin module